MICQLQGILAEKTPTKVTVDVNGVGYEVFVPISTYERLNEIGEKTKLLTYLNVREDALQLFGFYTQKEKWMFSNLISVSGIGPKLALSILSGCPVENLREFIVTANIEGLTRLPGVGKKTAQRMVTELMDKLGGEIKDAAAPYLGRTPEVAGKHEEALSALVSLGYNKSSGQKVLDSVLQSEPDITLESLIKKALQKI